MAEVLELIMSFLAIWIYGTEETPRYRVQRMIVRILAFGGAALLILGAFAARPYILSPGPVEALYMVCFLMVLIAEYEVGSKWLAVLAIVLYLVIISLTIAGWVI